MERNGLVLNDDPCHGPYDFSRRMKPFPVWQKLTCQIKSIEDFRDQAKKAEISITDGFSNGEFPFYLYDAWGYPGKEQKEIIFPIGEEIEFAVIDNVSDSYSERLVKKYKQSITTGVTLVLDHHNGLIGSYLIPQSTELTVCPDWLGLQLRLAYDCQPLHATLVVVNGQFSWWQSVYFAGKSPKKPHHCLKAKTNKGFISDNYKGVSFVLARKMTTKGGQ